MIQFSIGMEKPDFGEKLIDVRKAKGLTQEEVAEKCKITVRTIQRIESGQVKPRTFTIKIISDALGFDFFEASNIGYDVNQVNQNRTVEKHNFLWYLKDLFNLKTNTMKKVTLLSIIFGLIGLGLFVLTHNVNAQKLKSQLTFSTGDVEQTISKNEAIQKIKVINRKASFHNKSIDVIETYVKGSSYNFDTYVLLSEMVAYFGHSTKPAMEIANIVFLTNKRCDLFNEIAPLIFLNNHGCEIYVKMAKDASEATTEEEIRKIKEQINKYKQQAEFKTLEEAYNKQGKI